MLPLLPDVFNQLCFSRPLTFSPKQPKAEEQENVEPLETRLPAAAKPTETKSLLLSRLS